MLVLDSTIYASIIVKDEFYEACKELARQRSATLDLSFAESANVIWKHIYQLKRIPAEEADMRAEMLVKLIKYSKICLSGDFLPEATAIANLGIVKKRRRSGFGICRGASPYKEEEEPHADLW